MLEGAQRAAISYADNWESEDFFFLLASCVSEGPFAGTGEHSQVGGLSQGRDVDSELFPLGSQH